MGTGHKKRDALPEEKLRELVSEFERGQASKPITSALDALAADSADSTVVPLRPAFVALDTAARDVALRWLTCSSGDIPGLNHHELITIACGDDSHGSSTNGDHGRPSIVAARRSQLQNVELKVAPSLAALVEADERFAEFVSCGDLLILAWSNPLTELQTHHFAALTTLLDEFAAVGIVKVGGADGLEGAGWRGTVSDFLRRVQRHAGLVWQVQWTPTIAACCEEFWWPGQAAEIRSALRDCSRARGWHQAASLLADAVTRRMHHRARERDDLERRSTELEESRDQLRRKPLEDRRYRVKLQLDRLDAEITAENAQATQPLGEFSKLLQEIVDELKLSEFDAIDSEHAVHYSVNAAHFARINRRVIEALKNDLAADVEHVNSRVREIVAETERDLHGLAAAAPGLRWEKLAEEPIWLSVRNLLQIGKDVEIKMPRRGLIDLLTAGRQKVFILIMLMSLAGRMGLSKDVLEPLGLGPAAPALSIGFTMIALTVFIASMIDAIYRWRSEASQQSQKELKKTKDAILAEGLKLVDQVQKSKSTGVSDYLKEASKTLDKQLAEIDGELVARNERAAERSQDELATAIKRLDAETKRLEGQHKKVAEVEEKALAQLQDKEESLQKLLADVRRHHQSTPQKDPGPVAVAGVRKLVPERSLAAIASDTGSRSELQPQSKPESISKLAARRSSRVKSAPIEEPASPHADEPAAEPAAGLPAIVAEKPESLRQSKRAKNAEKPARATASIRDRLAARKAAKQSVKEEAATGSSAPAKKSFQERQKEKAAARAAAKQSAPAPTNDSTATKIMPIESTPISDVPAAESEPLALEAQPPRPSKFPRKPK